MDHNEAAAVPARRQPEGPGNVRRILSSAAASLIAVLCGSLLAPAASGAPDGTAERDGVTVRGTSIPASGGVSLRAKIIEPTGDATEPRPLLVMPASWATPNIEYVGAAARLAYESGYVVVSYTARGFYASEGEVEVAGEEDVADARKVIDWAVANTSAGAERVGMAGISYGAGISALTAAADDRVDAIAAMSGWADLVESLYPNRTVNASGAELLLGIGHLTGRFGDDLSELETAYREHRTEEALYLAEERSPANRIERLNANGTAVLLANAWQDSLFPPKQMTDMFSALEGPKRLMLAPGDHVTPEIFGAAGLPNHIWDTAARWFDQWLRGEDEGMADSAVELQPLNGSEWHRYPDWRSVTGHTETRNLTAPEQRHLLAPETGGLSTERGTDWRHSIDSGDPTLANSGIVMLSGALQGFARIPVGVSVPLVDRDDAAVWATEPYAEGVTVSGTPRLRVDVTPEDESVSLFAYLYDVGPLGGGSLISHKPVTLRDSAPGVPRRVDIPLRPTAWQLPEGHRLVLVVDTVDGRYRDESSGGEVVFGSSADRPATLSVPVE
ncbi:putative hydrolase, CocE/NonD family [Actinopolyspora xinjiangensis]|uniref:Putative hydrolase, CocE/NonD family n=1 Tax=Actinopolyspora xinjiangensis TaxID=405564 RepID=A0A1H0PC44_9ACTN|nr:putative hydrolase, CocE/NonD family [Actinopolyspora xinjiangensis]